MGLVGFLLWGDWKAWRQRTNRGSAAGCEPIASKAFEENTQFYLILAVLALPFPGLWWGLEHWGIEFLSLNMGRFLLVLNLYLVPFIAQLFFSQYRRVRKKLYGSNRPKEVLMGHWVYAPFLALSAMAAYIGGLLAMGLIGVFLWRDWNDFEKTGREPAGRPQWTPSIRHQPEASIEPRAQLLILIGLPLFPAPCVGAYVLSHGVPDTFLIAWLSLPLFSLVGRLCWLAYLWLREMLQSSGDFRKMLPRYLLASAGIPFLFYSFFILCAPLVAFSIGVGSFSVMLAIGYFLWQDEKELQKAKSEPLSTDG